jgi:hypothetical protein
MLAYVFLEYSSNKLSRQVPLCAINERNFSTHGVEETTLDVVAKAALWPASAENPKFHQRKLILYVLDITISQSRMNITLTIYKSSREFS